MDVQSIDVYGMSGTPGAILGVDKYDILTLEGDGRIERTVPDKEDGPLPHECSYLSFDFGDVYLSETFGKGPDYRQGLDLKKFFAWMDRRVGNELSPSLLEDLVTYYRLDVDRAEQLRQMIINGEMVDFVVEALKLVDRGKYVITHHSFLRGFLDSVYNGPTYTHMTGPRKYEEYPLGVEITHEGSLILRYGAQETQGFPYFSRRGDNSSPAMSRFTPADFKIMQVLAYGPMLHA